MVGLLSLPAVKRFSSSTMATLLQAAVHVDHVASFEVLLTTPAARQLSSADVGQLLKSALERNEEKCFRLVAALPAAWKLGNAAAAQMLQAAASQGKSRHLQLLLELPAAQRLSSSSITQALEDAMVAGQQDCARLLCESPAVQHLGSLAIAQLLQTAIRSRCDVGVRALCLLSGARQLEEATVLSLVHSALEQKLPECLAGPAGSAGLLSLPAVQQFSSGTLNDLLQTAAQAGCAGAAPLLCQLPARPSFEAQDVIARLVAAVNSVKFQAADLQLPSPAFEQAGVWLEVLQAVAPWRVAVQLAGDLLQEAVSSSSRGSIAMVRLLTSGLSVLQKLKLPEMCSLMQAAMQCAAEGAGVKVAALAGLPAAQKMDAVTLDKMLACAGQLQTPDAALGINALCSLPATQRLEHRSLQDTHMS
jgi:hypothetical protein